MKLESTKKDWLESWFIFQKWMGRRPIPKNLTEEEKKDLTEWMKIGPKYHWDSLRYINKTLENGRVEEANPNE